MAGDFRVFGDGLMNTRVRARRYWSSSPESSLPSSLSHSSRIDLIFGGVSHRISQKKHRE